MSTPRPDHSLPLYRAIAVRRSGDANALADILAQCRAQDPGFVYTPGAGGGEFRIWDSTAAALDQRLKQIAALAGFAIEAGPETVQPCWTPGRLAEAEHRLGSADGGSGDFAVVRLRIVPRRPGEGNVFESEFAGPPEIDALNQAVARGVASVWSEGPTEALGGGIVDTRVVFIDGAFHSARSTAAGFEHAAMAAMRTACQLAGMRRLEPLVEVELQVSRDHVLAVTSELAKSGGGELRRRLARSGVVVVAEVPLASQSAFETRLHELTAGRGKIIGTAQITRWAEVRRA